MEQLSYTKDDYHGEGGCAALIILQTDEVVEPEVRHWLPSGTTLYHTRIPSQATVSTESLLEMKGHIPLVCQLLPQHAPIKVIAYCCTSGATMIGESVVEQAVREVFPQAQVTNPLSAVKARLNALQVSDIGLLTPYVPSVTQAMIDHLERHNFKIKKACSFYEETESAVCRISRSSIRSAVEHLATDTACKAIFTSCTNLRTLDILDSLSHDVGIPVISSNSALAWHINELQAT